MNVQEFLTGRRVAYDAISHRATYGSQRLARMLHVPGRDVAKTVLLRVDRGSTYLVCVLPATKTVDLQKVSAALGGCQAELATEVEIMRHCPDCESGTLPPFGSQYGMKTLVEQSLVYDNEIVFEGNSHREAIRMRYQDFQAIEQPLVASFAVRLPS
ncbi:MAG: YbaK/EbsC family protein [Planctomycetaceae bacterium]|nr:YbaK/EbsC family protein [Planctomycetales bacterium]MCB9922714.1 YbaK/EbsC family protein [Planctomycetaceae bacterium]